MPSKSIVLILLGLTLSCGEQGTKQDFPSLARNRLSCEKVKVFKEMTLSGSYIKNILNCMIDQNDKEDTKHGIVHLVNRLDADGLDKFIQFLEQDAPFEYEGKYPYLSLFSVLLDRGNTNHPDQPAYATLSERYDDLQSFLLAVDPYRAANLVLMWDAQKLESGKTRLDLMLDHFLHFSDSLSENTLSGFTRSILEKSDLRQTFVSSALVLLENKDLYEGLEELLTIEKSSTLKRKCFERYETPLPRGSNPEVSCVADDSQKEKALDGYERYNRLKEKIGSENLTGFLENLLDSYLKTPSLDRQRRISSLIDGVSELAKDRQQPLGDLLYFLKFHQDTALGDLGFLLDEKGVIGQLLLSDIKESDSESESNNLPVLKVLGNKAGAVKLNQYLVDWLLNGGLVDGCAYIQPSLQKAFVREDHPEALLKLLKNAFTPQESCEGRIPLLVKARAYGKCSPHSCLENVDIEMIKNLHSFDDEEMRAPSEEVIRQLVDTSFSEARKNIRRDPNYLWYQGLATGPLEIKDLGRIQRNLLQFLKENGTSVKSIAAFDLELEKAEARIVRSDFLERLFEDMILRVYQFKYNLDGMFDAEKNEDSWKKSQIRIQRFLSGIYDDGPVARIIKNQARPESWSKLNELIDKGYPHAAGKILLPLGRSSSLFQSALYTDKKSSFAFVGSARNHSAAGYIRAAARNPSIKVKNRNVSVKYNNKTIVSKKNIVDIFDHPLLMSRIASFVGTKIHLSDEIKVPLGMEGQGDYLEACLEDCPLNPLNTTDLLEKPLTDRSHPLLPLFVRHRSLESGDFRLLLWYFARHYGLPVYQTPPGAVGTGKVSSLPSSLKFKRNFLGLDYLSYSPWQALINGSAKAFLNSPSLGQIANRKTFEFFNQDFYSNILDDDSETLINPVKMASMSPDFFESMPESQRILGMLDLMTSIGRSDEVILSPLVSFGEGDRHLCISPSTKREIPCVMKMPSKSLESFTEYLNRVFLAQLCPYFEEDESDWLLGKTQFMDPKEACNRPEIRALIAKNRESFNVDDSTPVPTWMMLNIFKDLEDFGKSPGVKPGLSNLSWMMGFYKEKIRKNDHFEAVMLRTPVFSSNSASWRAAFENDATGIVRYRPSMIDSFLYTVATGQEGIEGGDGKGWESLYGKTIDTSDEGLMTSAFVKYLQNHIRGQNLNHPAQSLLEFLLTQLEFINGDSDFQRKVKDQLIGLFADPYDTRSIGIYATLNVAIDAGYREFFSDNPPKIWKGPNKDLRGLELIKLLLRHETIRGTFDLLRRFSHDELSEGLSLVGTLMAEFGSTPREQAKTLGDIIDAAKSSIFSLDQNGKKRIHQFDSILLKIIFSRPSSDELKILDSFLSRLTQKVNSFSDRPAEGLLDQEGTNRETVLRFLVNDLPMVFRDYQKGNYDLEKLYFRDMMVGILKPFIDNIEPDSFLSLLNDPMFGLIDDHFLLEPLLKDRREMLNSILSVAQLASKDDYLLALDDAKGLLPKLNGFIKLVRNNIVFNDQKEAVDYHRGLEALDRVTGPSENGLMLEKQVDLLESWFEPKIYKWSNEGLGEPRVLPRLPVESL